MKDKSKCKWVRLLGLCFICKVRADSISVCFLTSWRLISERKAHTRCESWRKLQEDFGLRAGRKVDLTDLRAVCVWGRDLMDSLTADMCVCVSKRAQCYRSNRLSSGIPLSVSENESIHPPQARISQTQHILYTQSCNFHSLSLSFSHRDFQ